MANSPEQAAPQDSQEQKNLGAIDAAMQDGEFLDFLSKYPDSESLDVTAANEATIKERYETFKRIKPVTNELKKLLSSEISSDTGIQLNSEDLKCVDEHIEKSAIEQGPDFLKNWETEISKFRTYAAEIASSEKAVKNLQAGFEKRKSVIEKKEASFDKVKGLGAMERWTGWFKGSRESVAEAKMAGVNVRNIGKSGKEIESLKQELAQLEAQMNLTKDGVKRKCDEAREVLLSQFGESSGIMEVARQKVQEKLEAMAHEESSTETLDSAQDYSEEMAGISDVDYMKGLNREEYQKKVDNLLRVKIEQEIKMVVATASVSGKQNNLEQRLGKYFEKSKIGSSKDEEAKKFVMQTLGTIHRKLLLSSAPGDRVKAIAIRWLAWKHGKTNLGTMRTKISDINRIYAAEIEAERAQAEAEQKAKAEKSEGADDAEEEEKSTEQPNAESTQSTTPDSGTTADTTPYTAPAQGEPVFQTPQSAGPTTTSNTENNAFVPPQEAQNAQPVSSEPAGTPSEATYGSAEKMVNSAYEQIYATPAQGEPVFQTPQSMENATTGGNTFIPSQEMPANYTQPAQETGPSQQAQNSSEDETVKAAA